MVISTVCYLPYYLFNLFGKGLWFKRYYYIFFMHLSILVTEPKEYFPNIKGIHKQAVKESNELRNE